MCPREGAKAPERENVARLCRDRFHASRGRMPGLADGGIADRAHGCARAKARKRRSVKTWRGCAATVFMQAAAGCPAWQMAELRTGHMDVPARRRESAGA